MSERQADAGHTAHAHKVSATEDPHGKLTQIAKRIQRRDRRAKAGAHEWYRTGRDLDTAKGLLGHGPFEHWCGENLSYSERKAQRLMKAYRLVAPLVKHDNLSVLPPRSLVNKLAVATYLGDELIRAYLERYMEGDRAAGREAWEAIKAHQEDVRRKRVAAARAGREREGKWGRPHTLAAVDFATFLAEALGSRLNDVLDRVKACELKVLDERLVECLIQISAEAPKATEAEANRGVGPHADDAGRATDELRADPPSSPDVPAAMTS